MIKKIIGIFALILIFTSCSVNKYEKTIYGYFDTVIIISAYMDNQGDFEKLCELAESEFSKYYKLFDYYNNYENINNIKSINNNAGLKPVEVDKEIIELLEFSKLYYEKSNGYLNPVFGSVISIWQKYQTASEIDKLDNKIPTMTELEEAARHTDINDLIIDKEKSTVFLKDPEMLLDVGAIAKGYASQKVKEYLNKNGFADFLLNSGGNVVASGSPKNEKGKWITGVQAPDNSEFPQKADGIVEILYVNNKSIVTSGDYQRYFMSNGVRYHHIIDPKTLMPADKYRSVVIICDDSGIADALSTSCFLMPLEDSLELVNSIEGAEAMFLLGNNAIEKTEGFESYLK